MFTLFADEFTLENGSVLKGQASSYTSDGLVVRLDVGSFSDRVPWAHLNQDTLKRLAGTPKAAEFVEPFIEIQAQVRAKKEEITLRPVEKLDPVLKPGFVESITAPAGLALLGLLMMANLFAGYAVAAYRNRPAALVCGVSAVLPFVGPILFLSVPNEEAHAAMVPDLPAASTEVVNPMAGEVKNKSGLSVASTGGGGGGSSALMGQVWKRGETTFARRWFETTFTPFFRVVVTGPEKDMLIVIKTSKNEVVATRFSRITANDLHVILQTGTEVSVSFTDIAEVRVRHKDQK